MTTNDQFLIAVIVAAILVTLILLFFIITTIRHHRINTQLYEMQLKAEINTLELERTRIAADLHDDIGPLLSSVKMQIDCINSEDEEDVETVDRVGRYLDDIMNKLRETSNDLIPRVLTKKGLLIAIKDFAADINNTGKITVIQNITVEDLQISQDKEIHIYRVIQEIINNTIKHAEATIFTIDIRMAKGKVMLELSDNGKGFDFYKLKKESLGLGLRNIIRRVDILKGEVFFDSKPGKGVRYTIEVPIE